MSVRGLDRSDESKKRIEKGIQRLKAQGYTGSHPLKNEQRELFCQEYLISLNQSEAARQAGYSCAGKKGSELMADPRIRVRIEYLKRKRQEAMNIKQQEVVMELEKIAMSNILDFVDITPTGFTYKEELSDPTSELYKRACAIQELNAEKGKAKDKIGIKLYDKIQALDKLMRHLDLYERAKLQIEKEKLELMKIKNAPQETMEVGDDGFMDAMEVKAEEMSDFDDILEGEAEEMKDE